jgi:hypothetical protein
MTDNLQYRLSKEQKNQIADNLIAFQQDKHCLDKQTVSFISNWILTGPDEKRKAFYDVWDIVLKNFLPTTRPILFRACTRKGYKRKIVSFTGRIECARKFSQGKGILLICDTKETMRFESEIHQCGDYKNTFYPLSNVFKIAKAAGGMGFSKRLLDHYVGEDEYLMRIDDQNTHCLKWF